MSIKDLFSKNKITSFSSFNSASSEIESIEYAESAFENNSVVIPLLDYSKPFEYIKFGSAELYFEKAIERVHNTYPYDGSSKDKTQYLLSSSFVDRYIYDVKYPKSTGYITLTNDGYGNSSITDGYGAPVSSTDREFIFVGGGLHTASAGMETGKLYKNFDKSVKYQEDKNRTQNFRVNPSDGTTIEFWLNKDNFVTSFTEKEVILDLWNGELSSSSNYGRLTVYITGAADGTNPFRATLQNGTTGFADQSLAATSFTTASVADGNWHHYAISFLSQSAGIKSFFYVDGDLNNEQIIGSAGINELSGRLNAYIGALQTSPSGSSAAQYAGKLSGSLDEFRFWKKRRTSKNINLNWFRPIDGGSNTEDNNTSLGCYFKFNEGITGADATDRIVLDYSGRLANGSWTGYASGARNIGSCFVSASVISTETPDPIIRTNHPDVIALKSEMQNSGSSYDLNSNIMLYNRVPSYFRDQDQESNKSIKYLYQIISSYFDTLYAQIKFVPELTNKNYISASSKPIPFSSRLLENRGFKTADLFENTNLLEYIVSNDKNNLQFDLDLDEIKNLIYQNIYNNLDFIYKSKGTEASIRNLVRCFGFDDELVKLNVYTDGGTHYFNDNFKDTSVQQKNIDFNNPDYFSSTIYQTSSLLNAENYITGTVDDKKERHNAFTLEVGVNVPKKIEEIDVNYFYTGFLSSSVFGFHEASSNDYTWPASEVANAQVYLVRDKIESNRAKFVLTNRAGSIFLSSSYINEIYDNNQWVLAVRVKPEGYGVFGSVLSSSNPSYELSFYGASHNYGQLKDEFEVTETLSYADGTSYLSNPKRIYVGAHRTNFTGSVVEQTDLKLSSCRFWMDYLSNDELKAHNKDITNKGVDNSTRNSTMFSADLGNVNVPRVELLALDWDFDTVSSSSATGIFDVEDVSSGSTDTIYGWIDDIVRREHKGVGLGFGNTKTNFVENDLIYVSKKELPEISYTSDSIKIMGDIDKFFIEDQDVSDNFFSLEKSMYQIMSEEMLNVLASVVEFNTLIGRPVDRYRKSYKSLDHLRSLFFENVKSDMDFDRFVEYYRFIDDSISQMVSQLFPVSARHSEKISNMVESHIFERNKYENKFPLTTRLASTEGATRGIAELDYNWKFGHAPVDEAENKNCLWNKLRKERTDITDRETIKDIINNRNNISSPTLFQADGTSYQGSTFAINRLSKPYKESISFNNSIHGGINYNQGKDRDFVYNATYIHGPVSKEYPRGIPQNVLAVGLGEGQGTDAFIDCVDEERPNEKRKWRFSAVIGRNATGFNPVARTGKDYEYKVKSSLYWPSNVVSGNVNSGYNKQVVETFKSGTIITNLHSDTFSPTNDIGMQGPFAQAWVGGHQSRHVDLNKYDDSKTTTNKLDDQYTRPEAWRLLLRECDEADSGSPDNFDGTGSNDGAMAFVGPDYGGPYPDYTRKYAVRYRNERTKRPLNIRNIRTTTGSAIHGNFVENYEVVHTFGRKQNSKGFTNSGGSALSPFFDGLGQTTQEASLIGVDPGDGGNVVSNFNNSNRYPEDIKDQQVADANTFGKTVIASRFSAPGGFETMSEVFLDVASKEYSAYNAMPFRNLSVRGSGSGEVGTIRVNSDSNRREGLRTLLSRHSGRFGIDSQYGAVVSEDYNTEAAFHKTNRNTFIKGSRGDVDLETAETEEGIGIEFLATANDTLCVTSGSNVDNMIDSGSSTGFSFAFWAYVETAMTGNNHEGYFFRIHDDDFLSGLRPDLVDFRIFTPAWPNSTMRLKMRDTFSIAGESIWIWDNPFKSADNLDKWVHFVLTFEDIGNIQTTSAQLYLNSSVVSPFSQVINAGQAIRAVGDSTSKTAWFNSITSSVGIGDPDADNLKGIILDEISWWNKELTSEEINTLYNSGRPLDLTTGSYSGLKHYWPVSSSNDYIDGGSGVRQLFLEDVLSNGGDISGSVDRPNGNEIVFQSENYNYTVTTTISTVTSSFDNFNVSRPIPSQDYNYSWVTSSLGEELSVRSGNQLAFGYWPKDGILSASTNASWRENGFDSAVNFPSGSGILGS